MIDVQVAEGAISPREAEVLAALGEHLTNAEIAARLVISIRTVESHVSSLLRKFGVSDRRALAAIAAERRQDRSRAPAAGRPALPSPLTSFIGRAAERAALARAVGEHRLVSAVGPGGAGKTRLALAVAADLAGRFADGVWFVDLVPVNDPTMVAPAVAAGLGLGEQPGRSAEETVLSWAADREALLVLDNCEHVVDGVAVLAERLLSRGPRLAVLATTRARLLLPFERVFEVGGLSVEDGDATALFVARGTAAGAEIEPSDAARIDRICRALDGLPLAIELAAARLPALGLDGLEAGLADRLQVLTGPQRADERHRSLRSALDWSHALLDPAAQAVLRRVSVFAGPFRPADADAVVAWPPIGSREAGPVLAGLAERSLLVASPGPDGTRYRALETVRQYGAELLAAAGELDEVRRRHLLWSRKAGLDLQAAADVDGAGWRGAFDRLAGELRAALGWAAARPEHRSEAHDVAMLLGTLCHRRGMPAEAQRRYVQAADLADGPGTAAVALQRAAGSAEARLAGDDTIRLRRAAADAAVRAGEPAIAARELARGAELVNRGNGIIAELPGAAEVDSLLAEARTLAGDDLAAQARIATAEAFMHPEAGPEAARLTRHALDLARRAGDRLAESVALDRLITVQLAQGDPRAALASAMRRMQLLDPDTVDAELGFELPDALGMATDAAIATGDLTTARGLAEHIRDLPLHREIGHVGSNRLMTVTALTGDWAETVADGRRFLEGWERAGRPRIYTLRRAAIAAAAVHGMRGEAQERREWLRVVDALALPGRAIQDTRMREFFDALLFLHIGRPDEALRRVAADPAAFTTWCDGIWQGWYAALAAEAAVLAGHPAAGERIRTARTFAAGNPVAAALADRAEGLASGDRDAVRATASVLEAAGCRYQSARSLTLAREA